MIYIERKQRSASFGNPETSLSGAIFTKTQMLVVNEISTTEVKTSQQIADAIKDKHGRMYITEASVRVHLTAIRKKLGKDAFLQKRTEGIIFNPEKVIIVS